jgi:hypothetical protein
MKDALKKISEFLTGLCGQDDMASVHINNTDDVFLKVGCTTEYPRMTIEQFAEFVETGVEPESVDWETTSRYGERFKKRAFTRSASPYDPAGRKRKLDGKEKGQP